MNLNCKFIHVFIQMLSGKLTYDHPFLSIDILPYHHSALFVYFRSKNPTEFKLGKPAFSATQRSMIFFQYDLSVYNCKCCLKMLLMPPNVCSH